MVGKNQNGLPGDYQTNPDTIRMEDNQSLVSTIADPSPDKSIQATPSVIEEIHSPNLIMTLESSQNSVCSPLFSTPIEELSGIVSDGYHPPPLGQDGRHQGVDFAYYHQYGRASIAGERVQAILGGTVAGLINDRFPYGNAVIIETPQDQIPLSFQKMLELQNGVSIYILYAHLSGYPPLIIGDPIRSCQMLGWVGRSGNTGVAHLHLETRIGKAGQVFSSMAYYSTDASPEERTQYLIWRTSGQFWHFDPMLLLGQKPIN